ncbi:alpha/beta hydrolase [Kribbella sandramycini]|uniref:Alpha/beta hydrolase n=1 Tax=Kribbella sandramycini TaxID=60450 RepID=A0A7Y4L733_9ACTN|nr:alpha/beta hydrolase [Kribbella sandramycini]MBB6568815.1 proline iminopeptidase [Kribbella sandramycini]NOL45584.1 alpha/beta hydrolase [Kribbella sandramycini]
MEINGTNLYVAQYGVADSPPVLFIHGHGGGYHWTQCQGERLGSAYRVIAPDQRGVLRSDPADVEITMEVLLADFEELRRRLGIERWAVIAHSAGGNYATEYAVRHPEAVSAVVFDCPCWDFDANDRHRLPLFARWYDEAGAPASAARCRALAALPRRLTADDKTYELAFGLGDTFQNFSWFDPADRPAFEALGRAAGFTDEMWSRSDSHLTTLRDLYTSKLPLLARLTQPTLLIEGIQDPATDPVSVAAYRNTARAGRTITFTRSGHFPHFEEPDHYTDVVLAFLSSVRT